MKFDELGLSQKVLAAVDASGYTTPTPIQAQAIPPALAGPRHARHRPDRHRQDRRLHPADAVAGSNRAAPGRACRARSSSSRRANSPRRSRRASQLRRNHKLNLALLIGGVSFGDQETKIKRGVDVLIATPGRLLDLFERGKLLLTGIEILVIDEADRMLDMGFIPDIEHICKLLPFTRQTLFFSATMPPEITRLTEAVPAQSRAGGSRARRLDRRDHHAGPRRLASATRQARDAAPPHSRRRQLQERDHLLQSQARRRDPAQSLEKHGFNAGALHGDMDQRRAWPRSTRSSTATSPDRLLRRRCARPRHSRRQPCLQLRRADAMPRTMSTASAAPAAPGAPASR